MKWKAVLQVGIVMATLIFVGEQLWRYGSQVLTLTIAPQGYSGIGIALLITFLSHCWAGVAWSWVLAYLHHPRSLRWAVAVYLRTNLAKYLPGNIWHFVGRVRASQAAQIPLSISVLSVVLEAFLMAGAALILALGSPLPGWIRVLGLGTVLAIFHPQVLSPVLDRLERSKRREVDQKLDKPLEQSLDDRFSDHPTATPDPPPEDLSPRLTIAPRSYPWKPLLGELIFVSLRGIGFWAIVMSLYPLPWVQMGALISGFSVAWVLGLVIPGAPGGLGVFEATAIVLLKPLLPVPIVLAAITFYRIMSTLAEAIGAGFGYRFTH